MMYDRRSLLKLLGGMSAGAALPGSVPSAAAQDIINWKAVTNHRNGAAWSYRWPWLQDEIKTRTNGRIVLNVTTVPELGFTGQELLRALRSNLVDFSDIVAGTKRGLATVLRPQIDARHVTGEHYPGFWADVGTPERLAALDRSLRL